MCYFGRGSLTEEHDIAAIHLPHENQSVLLALAGRVPIVEGTLLINIRALQI